MATPEITEPVRRLLHDHIPSIERLEILLLLYEARDRTWSVEEIEERIRSTPESIRQNVSALVTMRLVEVDSAAGARSLFRYAAENAAIDDVVHALAVAYRTRRVAVIELIYAERRDSVRGFSDAFKLGKTHDR